MEHHRLTFFRRYRHRLGEWVMLMLGESVLSLLIVEESAGRKYYVTFYSGMISVT